MLRTRVRAGGITGFVMSAVFAALLTLVQIGDTLVPQLTPHFGQATPITIRVPYASFIEKGSSSSIGYEHTRIVVPRGTVLDENDDSDRVAYAFETTLRDPSPGRVLANGVIYLTLFLLCATYLRRFGPSRTRLLRTQVGLFATMSAMVILAKLILLFTPISEFWIPLAAVPLWCTFALERRTSFLINVMLAFMTASLVLFDLPLLTVLITRGIAASLLFIHRRHPREMVFAGAGAGVVAAIVYAAVLTVFEGRFDPSNDLLLGVASPLLGCVGGGVLAGVLAQLFRQLAERALGSVSRDRLIDLTDLGQPLLQKMAREAPGSWEHARAMANLAEAASSAVGADALLTRVGAYYHDLGKTIQPKYFVENLAHGERSPHEDLEPEVSADAIMAHVVQGAKILREGRVPEPVVEFAYTHHGTQLIEYFWHKCKERGNPKKLAEDFFRYPGMKPQTKETAILMLVDSIEAASRTIQPPDRTKFEEMIQRIIFTKLKSGQLDESGLTLEDCRILIAKMTDTLVKSLTARTRTKSSSRRARRRRSRPRPRRRPKRKRSCPAIGRRELHRTSRTEGRATTSARSPRALPARSEG